MDLSRKDFVTGAVAGAAAFAAPRIFAKTKGEKMDNEMNSVEPSEFVARPFAQFDKGGEPRAGMPDTLPPADDGVVIHRQVAVREVVLFG